MNIKKRLEQINQKIRRLYNQQYALRVRRTENDQKMLTKAKEWTRIFEKAIKRGKSIKSISRRKNKTLKINIDRNRLES